MQKRLDFVGCMIVVVVLSGVVSTGYTQVDTTSEHYYLYTYFKNLEQEAGPRIAVSSNGIEWVKINDEEPLFTPEVGIEKLARDPSVWLDPTTGVFHCVWTSGWHETGIGYATSTDLQAWSDQKFLSVGDKIPGCVCCWMPELFYDDLKDSVMIYWSTEFDERGKRTFYVMTKDFITFTDPAILFDPGYTEIDASIIKYSEGKYYLFFKDEREPGIAGMRTLNIHYVYGPTPQGPWSEVSERITNSGTESPSPILIGGELRVYFDPYATGPSGTYRMVKVTGDPLEDTTFPWEEGEVLTADGEPFTYSSGSIMEIQREYVMHLLYAAPLPPFEEISPQHVLPSIRQSADKTIGGEVRMYNILGRNIGTMHQFNNVNVVNDHIRSTAPGIVLVKPDGKNRSQSILSVR